MAFISSLKVRTGRCQVANHGTRDSPTAALAAACNLQLDEDAAGAACRLNARPIRGAARESRRVALNIAVQRDVEGSRKRGTGGADTSFVCKQVEKKKRGGILRK